MQRKYHHLDFTLLLQYEKEDQSEFEKIATNFANELFDLDLEEEENKINQSLKETTNKENEIKEQEITIKKGKSSQIGILDDSNRIDLCFNIFIEQSKPQWKKRNYKDIINNYFEEIYQEKDNWFPKMKLVH